MSEYIPFAAAFFVSLAFNFALSRFWNSPILRSSPRPDRWGGPAVPLAGGPVIFLIVSGFALFRLVQLRFPGPVSAALAGAAIMFALGLVDDLFELKAQHKFLAEIAVALLVIELGVVTTLFPHPLLNFAFTFLWILAIPNAFNLLDNMDGLAGGIGLIAASFMAIHFFADRQLFLHQLGLVLAAALLGFLIFNFKPARIYLGDSGSLLVGYLLAVLAVLGSRKAGTSLFVTIVFPVVLLALPIFDTVMVSITRKLRGQSPFLGGKDHLSHRLVMLGMSDRQAVALLYAIALALGLSTLLLRNVPIGLAFAVYFLGSVALVLFGIYVGTIQVVAPPEPKVSANHFARINSSLSHKRWILHILVDLLLVSVVYYLSYVIRFEGVVRRSNLRLFLASLPLLLVFKLFSLSYFGVYRIDHRYFSIADSLNVVKGITLGSTLTVFSLTFVARFSGYSRALFFIDWMLSLLVVGGVKVFYRILDELFYPARVRKSRRIVFIGETDTFQAIRKYLQIKEDVNFSLDRHIPPEEIETITDGDFIFPQGGRASLVLLEEKFAGAIGGERLEQWRLKGFNVVDEKEFFTRVIP